MRPKFDTVIGVNYYEMLDVAPSASAEEIKTAYRIQAQLHHPDRLHGANEKVRQYAEERLKKINAAYTVLSDSTKRRDYDARLRQRARSNFEEQPAPEPDYRAHSRRNRQRSERDAAAEWLRQEAEFRRAEEFVRRQEKAAAEEERRRREAEEAAYRAARTRFPRTQLQDNRLVVTFRPGLWTPLLRIPAGEFRMGSDPLRDARALPAERPQHTIRLSESFISQFPITNEQYQTYLHAAQPDLQHTFEADKAQHPVGNVSWDDALAFCNWLTGPGWRFSLPTEAQWEKAARGADGRVYPWGDEWDISRANADDLADTTTPVGLFSPGGDSVFGVAEMSGNVWEWCADWYDAEEYAHRQIIRDPVGPTQGDGAVIRGGAFDSTSKHARCAHRNWHYPFKRRANIGFRVVAVPVEN
ncbi:MAG: SUMF1/EgtB/PvdO family nonheme iron enzyme [Anaerolineales bacterium]